MTELTRPIRRLLSRSDGPEATTLPVTAAVVETASAANLPSIAVDIAESDPLLAYLQTASGPVELAVSSWIRQRFGNFAMQAWRSSSRSSRRAN